MNTHQSTEAASFELRHRAARQLRSDTLASMFRSGAQKIRDIFSTPKSAAHISV
jgi:hypothetical protein